MGVIASVVEREQVGEVVECPTLLPFGGVRGGTIVMGPMVMLRGGYGTTVFRNQSGSKESS